METISEEAVKEGHKRLRLAGLDIPYEEFKSVIMLAAQASEQAALHKAFIGYGELDELVENRQKEFENIQKEFQGAEAALQANPSDQEAGKKLIEAQRKLEDAQDKLDKSKKNLVEGFEGLRKLALEAQAHPAPAPAVTDLPGGGFPPPTPTPVPPAPTAAPLPAAPTPTPAVPPATPVTRPATPPPPEVPPRERRIPPRPPREERVEHRRIPPEFAEGPPRPSAEEAGPEPEEIREVPTERVSTEREERVRTFRGEPRWGRLAIVAILLVLVAGLIGFFIGRSSSEKANAAKHSALASQRIAEAEKRIEEKYSGLAIARLQEKGYRVLDPGQLEEMLQSSRVSGSREGARYVIETLKRNAEEELPRN